MELVQDVNVVVDLLFVLKMRNEIMNKNWF